MSAAAQIPQLIGTRGSLYEQYARLASAAATPEARISDRLSKTLEVESVYINRTADLFEVWTIIDQDDEAVCDKIYEHERSLIREIQGRFDFHVIARRGRPLHSLISLGFPVWYRR